MTATYIIDEEQRRYFKEFSNVLKTNTISDYMIDHSEFVESSNKTNQIKGFYYNSNDNKIRVLAEVPKKLSDELFEGICIVESFKELSDVLPF